MTSKVQPSETTDTTTKIESRVGPDTKFITNNKGKRIHCSYWRPSDDVQIRGLVFICHGFGEHLQWYEDLALRLTATGLLAFGHDHVGHGRSEGVRGYVDSVDDYVTDVLQNYDDVRSGYPGLPCFIVGHSMGGMITIKCGLARPHYFDGVVLMGPLIKANSAEATPPKIFLARLVARILPYLAVAKLKLDHVTRDEDMKSRMRKDPLRYQGGIRARWAMAGIETLLYFENHIPEVEWPFLILHGEKDQLCAPEGSQMLLDQAKSSDKTLKMFPLAYHHLYLELPEVRHEALQDTVDWITARISPSKK
ncbi:monoglyceride lipase-like [Homarus americanus]|uniref:monoglyceride lipase-like n=1 Tax=Homarus americanus TaxID=6706 RepID=UPI001C4429BD|nr:monoglyceride lipase-like [Homarus americanus]